MAARNTYPGSRNQQHLRKILEQIRGAAVPTVGVNPEWLKRFGVDNNNSVIIPVLKFIGFIDNKGTATEKWKGYKSQGSKYLSQVIKDSYSELFLDYPQAHRLNAEMLKTYFQSNHMGSAQTMGYMISTFKTLCSLADFNSNSEESSLSLPPTQKLEDLNSASDIPSQGRLVSIPVSNSPAININIQLQIPETDNPEVYERFFKAMREHLLDVKNS